MQFLCDQMLAGLGKWLRTAGYDTEIAADGIPDSLILEKAVKEKRLLLTRDRHFIEMNAPEGVIVYLKGNSLEEWIRELGKEINWLYRPFSRCLVCNAVLTEATQKNIERQVPLDVRSIVQKFWYCPQCDKVYWEGSHTARMLVQLQAWMKD